MFIQNMDKKNEIVITSDCESDYIESVSSSSNQIIADNSFAHACHQASRFCSQAVNRDYEKEQIIQTSPSPELAALSFAPGDAVHCAPPDKFSQDINVSYLINNNIDTKFIEKVEQSLPDDSKFSS